MDHLSLQLPLLHKQVRSALTARSKYPSHFTNLTAIRLSLIVDNGLRLRLAIIILKVLSVTFSNPLFLFSFSIELRIYL